MHQAFPLVQMAVARAAEATAAVAATTASAGMDNSRVECGATTVGTGMAITAEMAVVETAVIPAVETMAASNEITLQITLDRGARRAGIQGPKACSRRTGLKTGGKATLAMSPHPGNV